MSDPVFGIAITQIDDQPRPAVTADMSVVGLVGTAPDADADTFPVDTPVKLYSDDADTLAKLGTTGTLYPAIAAINGQLGDFEVAAQIVVVRVTAGESDAATIANLVGDINAKTGMYALKKAGAALATVPRLIGVPGYTWQGQNGIGSVTVDEGGTGYTADFPVTATGGNGSGFAGTAHVTAGAVTSISVTDMGEGYTSAPTIVLSAGAGTGAAATAVLDAVSNAVCAALPALCEALLAVAVVDGPADTESNAEAWRATMSSKRLIPVIPRVSVLDADGNTVPSQPLSPFVLGLAVARDHAFNGRPFHSWANQPVQGIVGVSRDIDFSILDGATEGQQLLSHNIGILVRGGSTDGAIADGGYVFVGTDTCSADALWQFYHVVRGRDYIHLMAIKTLRYYLGRYNITGQAVQEVLNTMEFALRDIQATGDLLGYSVGFTRDLNSPEQLRLGKLVISFAAEEPPVLRYLGIQSARYRPALDTLLANLMSQLDVAA